MIQVTTSAAQHLDRVRRERGMSDRFPRLVSSNGKIQLTFPAVLAPGDERVEADGITVLLAPEVASRLEGSTIDSGDKDGREGLIIRAKRLPQ